MMKPWASVFARSRRPSGLPQKVAPWLLRTTHPLTFKTVLAMKTLLLGAVVATVIGSPAFGQCPVRDVTFSSYGSGCSGMVFSVTPQLAGSWSPNSCQVALWLNPYPGCCNTLLTQQILVFGVAPTNIPLPQVGQGCALLVSPVVILPFDRSIRVWRRGLSDAGPGTVWVQGVLQYYTTVNGITSHSMSQGLKITVR